MSLRSAPATGVIVHCNQDPIEEAWHRLRSHCENRKPSSSGGMVWDLYRAEEKKAALWDRIRVPVEIR
jgi:hypothetical protein